MTQAEKTFQERGEQIAKRLDAMLKYVRDIMKCDDPAIDRAVGAHSVRTLIKRAELADKEQANDK